MRPKKAFHLHHFYQAAGSGVPRAIRAFDFGADDALADEHDLWAGLGLSFTPAGGTSPSEVAARADAQNTIKETLEIKSTVLANGGALERLSPILPATDGV